MPTLPRQDHLRSSGTDADESLPAGPQLAVQATMLGDLNAIRSQLRRVIVHVSDAAHWYDDPIGLGDLPIGGSPGEEISYVADEPLSSLRAVALSAPGRLRYARLPETAALAPLGITVAAALTDGHVQLQSQGELQDPFFNFTVPGPVLLGLNGVLTQVQPAGVLIQVVMGFAIAADTMVIRIGAPLQLAAAEG